MSLEKYFWKCEIRESKCEHITVFISHSSVFCRKRLPDCEFKWDFKRENYHIACHLSAGQFSTTVVSFSVVKTVILSWSCRRWVFLGVRCLIDLILKKYHRDTPTASEKLYPQRQQQVHGFLLSKIWKFRFSIRTHVKEFCLGKPPWIRLIIKQWNFVLCSYFIAKMLEKPSFKQPCFNEIHSFDNNFKHSI